MTPLSPKPEARRAAADKKRVEDERARLGTSNLRIDPSIGSIGDGKAYHVNAASGHGHLLAMHRRQPNTWTKPMVDAGARFAMDYDLAEARGMKASDMTPRVDQSTGSGDGLTAVAIVATERLRQLRVRIGDEHFLMLALACGLGLTFTELHAMRMGDKRSLSDTLRIALRKADAFYCGQREMPKSDFALKAERVIAGAGRG